MKSLLLASTLCIAGTAAYEATWTPANTGLIAQPFGVNAIIPDPVDPLTCISNRRTLFRNIASFCQYLHGWRRLPNHVL